MLEAVPNPYDLEGKSPQGETLVYPVDIEDTEKNESTILYSSECGRVLLPTHPLVPPDGGVNLTVIPNNETGPYYENTTPIESTLPAFLLSLAAARSVIYEPASTRYSRYSQWVNVHAIPRFGGEKSLQFEVTGKNAMNDKGWAMPVKYPKEEGNVGEEYPGYTRYDGLGKSTDTVNYEMYPVVKEEIDQIRSQLAMREQEIREELKDVVIFDAAKSEVKNPDDKIIMAYRNFEILMAKSKPHVEEGGLHLWIREASGKKTEGVQSDVKNALEQFIMAEAVSKVIYEVLGRKIEIHFSSNWGLATQRQQDEAVARGKDPSGNYIKESLAAHANLYAAPPDKEYVNLPERPVYENPEILEETRHRVKSALEQYLPSYIAPFENTAVEKFML